MAALAEKDIALIRFLGEHHISVGYKEEPQIRPWPDLGMSPAEVKDRLETLCFIEVVDEYAVENGPEYRLSDDGREIYDGLRWLDETS